MHLLYLMVFIKIGQGNILSMDIRVVEEDNTEDNVKEEYQFKLQAPPVYSMNDLKMSLLVLFILFLMIITWYFFARALIYCVFRNQQKNWEDTEDTLEDIIYEQRLNLVGL